MLEKGYKPLGSTNGEYKPSQTGIDGIYENPNPLPDHVITEAKFNKARLGKTNDGKQMCNYWVTDDRLKKAGLNKKERKQILKSLRKDDDKVQKLIIRNKLDGNLVVKTLDKDAKIIGINSRF